MLLQLVINEYCITETVYEVFTNYVESKSWKWYFITWCDAELWKHFISTKALWRHVTSSGDVHWASLIISGVQTAKQICNKTTTKLAPSPDGCFGLPCEMQHMSNCQSVQTSVPSCPVQLPCKKLKLAINWCSCCPWHIPTRSFPVHLSPQAVLFSLEMSSCIIHLILSVIANSSS